MPQNITFGFQAMMDEANNLVPTLTVAEARRLMAEEGAVLVDVRDVRELEREGRIPEAFHCPRGMLEFWIDPECPYHKEAFDQDKTYIFLCAAGWRSVLSAATAHRMGLSPVAHVGGGFRAWKDSGAPVDYEKHVEHKPHK